MSSKTEKIRFLETPEVEISESERRKLHNVGASADKLRKSSLRELLILDSILRYDYKVKGSVYQLCRSERDGKVSLYDMAGLGGKVPKEMVLNSAEGLYYRPNVEFIHDLSNGDMGEYLKTLRYFYLKERAY